LEGESVIITASSEDSVRILRLNNFKFAGATLVIEVYQPLAPIPPTKGEKADMSEDAKKTEDRIKGILSTRYDANLKLLNLSALGHDPGLVQMGMFDVRNRISKLFPVLMVVCDRLFTSPEQKREAIISVTLADNDLDSVSTITALAQTFPDLQNLDLSRNRFSELRALESWLSRFRKLQNLEITRNPLEVTMPEYAQEIKKWFPALRVLNGVQVRRSQEAVILAEVGPQTRKTNNLTPIPINGSDFRDVNHIGEGFVGQFFTLYDSNRDSLVNQFYDAHSVFSVSINVSAPRSEQSPSSHPFSTLQFKQSRNLAKVRGLHAQTARVFRGIEAIKSIWLQFLPTKHPVLGAPSTKYLIDCHPLPGLSDPNGQSLRGVDGLILTVHGEYEERGGPSSATVPRSFSRTFVLGPGSSGGSSVRVVSDTLMLRAWGPLSLPLAGQDKALAVMQTEEELRQEDLTRQLIIQTHMTPEYAKLCLAETGWNLDQALIAFNANKVYLSPKAHLYRC
jgi:nuclear RNA export factor